MSRIEITIPAHVVEILKAEMAAHGDPDLAVEAAQECFETPITNEGMDALTEALDKAVAKIKGETK